MLIAERVLRQISGIVSQHNNVVPFLFSFFSLDLPDCLKIKFHPKKKQGKIRE